MKKGILLCLTYSCFIVVFIKNNTAYIVIRPAPILFSAEVGQPHDFTSLNKLFEK